MKVYEAMGAAQRCGARGSGSLGLPPWGCTPADAQALSRTRSNQVPALVGLHSSIRVCWQFSVLDGAPRPTPGPSSTCGNQTAGKIR